MVRSKSSKIVLHIGHPKTASSTIQKYLRKKKEKYAERHGIEIIPTLGHEIISYALGVSDSIENFPYGIVDNSFTVASFETLWSRINSSSESKIIADYLKARFEKINIVVYLRRQDESFLSGYYTRCLKGGCERFSDIKFVYTPKFNHRNRLEIWEAAFGRESLTVRRYGRDYLFQGDILKDFCHAARMPYINTVFAGTNRSPKAETIELIRLLLGKLDNGNRHKRLIQALCAPDLPGTKLGLSLQARQEILDQCEADNRIVAQRYFGEDELFSHPIPDDGIDYPTLSADQISCMTGAILRYHGKAAEPFPCEMESDAALHLAAQRLVSELSDLQVT